MMEYSEGFNIMCDFHYDLLMSLQYQTSPWPYKGAAQGKG